jgi:hypothetical protein
VLDDRTGTFVEVDFNFRPYASGGGMRLYQEEEVYDAYVVLHGTTPRDRRHPESENAIALVTVVGLVQSVFGYPNEESFWKDPRGHVGHGFFEVVGSQWADHVDDYNKRTYGKIFFSPARGPVRHFFIGSKDCSAQFLARELHVEVFVTQSSDFVEAEVQRRLKNWVFEQMSIEEDRGGPFGREGQRQPGTCLWRLPVASHRALTPEAPGWDAIDAALAALVGETVPTHWASGMADFRWGVWGISAYSRGDHWLLVTYGLSTLFVGDSVSNTGKGFAEELTIRVQAGDGEADAPVWAVRLLEVLGQVIYQRSAPMLPGAKSSVQADDGPASLLAFAADPELLPIETGLGPVQFVTVVPVSSAAYQQMRTSSVEAVIDGLRARDPLLVVKDRQG